MLAYGMFNAFAENQLGCEIIPDRAVCCSISDDPVNPRWDMLGELKPSARLQRFSSDCISGRLSMASGAKDGEWGIYEDIDNVQSLSGSPERM